MFVLACVAPDYFWFGRWGTKSCLVLQVWNMIICDLTGYFVRFGRFITWLCLVGQVWHLLCLVWQVWHIIMFGLAGLDYDNIWFGRYGIWLCLVWQVWHLTVFDLVGIESDYVWIGRCGTWLCLVWQVWHLTAPAWIVVMRISPLSTIKQADRIIWAPKMLTFY
jgi:hypothetical protein